MLSDGVNKRLLNSLVMIITKDNKGIVTKVTNDHFKVLTAYKRVDKKIKPVPGVFPEDARVIRQFPEDPLTSLPPLTPIPPDFEPTKKLTFERIQTLDINKDKFLWPEEEKLFLHILKLNEKSLAFTEEDRGTLRDDYFSPYIIPVVPHVPWSFPNIPIAPGIKDKVLKLLKDKISAGVYEPSQSSYRSRWFCVLKKNGDLRIVHDLQPLNKVSIRDAGVPPILEDFIEPFAGKQCYTVFDLFSGFDTRKVDPASRDLTSFLTPLGLLRITSIPMGYTNSPAEFQNCMVFVLQDEIPDKANVFIDDLPIKGPTSQYLDDEGKPETIPENPGIRRFIWEHAVDVHRIMHRVQHSGATFSPKKMQLCKPEVVIVGQKCTPNGRLPDDTKVNKVLNWPELRTVKDVRGFLGLCGTMRIWIKNYSLIARPLTELVRKEVEFIWDERRQQAFDYLKQCITSAPALRSIDYQSDAPIYISIDSSNIAVGFILSQEDENGKRHPARFGSLPFNEREARYSQPKLELYGCYRALRHWRLYLVGVKKLIVEVDAKYIKDMLNNPDLQPNAAINRWIQGILLFDFELHHIPGEKHRGPDALSRKEPTVEDWEEAEMDEDRLDEIALLAQVNYVTHNMPKDPEYAEALPSFKLSPTSQDQSLLQIREFLKTLRTPTFPTPQAKLRFMKKASHFFMKGPNMYKRRKAKLPLLVVFDIDKRLAILSAAHEKLGHRGAEYGVFYHIRDRFVWPHMYQDVKHHVSTCHQCQLWNTKRAEENPTIRTPSNIFVKLYADVLFMPNARGYKYIVIARCDLSHAAEGRALKNLKSKTVAKFFWEEIICRYGHIAEIVTDNGSEFAGACEELMKRYGIHQIRISPWNKHANGVVEQGHFVIREAILKDCNGRIGQWPDKVPHAIFADKITTRRSTGFSPYYLLYGTDPVLPFDLTEATFMISGYRAGLSSTELLALRIRQLEKRPEDIKRAADAIRKSRLRSKAQFEKRFKHRLRKKPIQPRQLVLVRNSERDAGLTSKYDQRYFGPFIVRRRTKGGSFVLEELDGTPLRKTVAAFRLFPYMPRISNSIRLDTQTNSDESSDPESGSDSTGSDRSWESG